MAKYDVSNPHPDFNKDSNILNEYGHTKYPKMVYPNGQPATSRTGQEQPEGVIVNNKSEEDEVMNQPKNKEPKENKPAGWGDKK